MMVLVGFTELIAIGAGLVRLKGLIGGEPPSPPSALTDIPILPRPRMMGALPISRFPPTAPPHKPTAPPHKMGELVAPQQLLGRMKRN
jgi:hypothetical protein